jgi:uracil-DNA glycosylase
MQPPLVEKLLAEVRACRACAPSLPLGARPLVQLSATARILICSQAPGTRAHLSGIPFSDASGDRLRAWTGLSNEQFYDERRVAIVPVGLCYPGRSSHGDAPPRPECAPLWRDRLLSLMPQIRLTLLVGGHAQNQVLGSGAVAKRVREFPRFLPRFFPLPHPSWRSRLWVADNPWFEAEVLPALRDAIDGAIVASDEFRRCRTASAKGTLFDRKKPAS